MIGKEKDSRLKKKERKNGMECEQSHKTFVARQYKYVWGAFFDFEKPSEVLLKFASFFHISTNWVVRQNGAAAVSFITTAGA